ncbi:hypothetical protein AOLI_G00191040 [Acnodon oligacanthus]
MFILFLSLSHMYAVNPDIYASSCRPNYGLIGPLEHIKGHQKKSCSLDEEKCSFLFYVSQNSSVVWNIRLSKDKSSWTVPALRRTTRATHYQLWMAGHSPSSPDQPMRCGVRRRAPPNGRRPAPESGNWAWILASGSSFHAEKFLVVGLS